MLHATISNIDPTQLKICRIAVSSLMRTLPSTKGCYNTPEQHSYIMGGIFKALAIDDQDTQEAAFCALGEIPFVAS
jgi:hypothetical protein